MNGIPDKRQILLISLLMAICLVSFSNTFSNSFMWDDPYLISENPHIRDYANIPLFFTPGYWNTMHPFAGCQPLYRPLRTITFTVDYYFWKLNPAGYHLTNLLLHMLNVMLVFALASAIEEASAPGRRKTVSKGHVLMGLPFLTALFFSVHPVHTESITFIKNRSDLMAFLFFLTAILLFIKPGASASKSIRLLSKVSSLLCFALAILSKEMALSLPGVLVLYLICFQKGTDWKRKLLLILPYGLVIILYFWFRLTMLTHLDQQEALFQISFFRHVLSVIKTTGIYLGLLAFPVHLNVERFFSIPETIREPATLLSLIILAGIAFIVAKIRHPSRIMAFSIFYVLVTLIPAANIVFLISRPIAEQRLYIPSFGFCLLLAWGVQLLYLKGIKQIRPATTTIIAWVLAGLILTGYSIRTIQRNLDWRDPVTFFSRAVQSNPNSSRLYNNLGIALAEQGRSREAIISYETALRINPSHANAYNNLGVELAEAGRFQEAVSCYEKALDVKPDYASAHDNLGVALMHTENIEAAVTHGEKAVLLKPDASSLNNLGLIYAAAGRLEDAIKTYIRALGISPDYILALNNLGTAALRTGAFDETVNRLLSPVLSSWQLARVYNSAATTLFKAGDRVSARRYYQSAVQVDPTYIDGLYNLGLTLAIGHEYREATDVYARILAIQPDEKEARKRYAYCLNRIND